MATGFGRTGTMFACEQERVAPDFLCLGKGLTGGYLPLAATLTTERVYDGFLGAPEEARTFFHGHTFTGNPLACAAALASLDAFESEGTLVRLQPKIRLFGDLLAELAGLPEVAEVRGRGLMAGIDLGEHDPALRLGHRVALEARERGAIVRPLGDVVVLMPPLTIEKLELRRLIEVVRPRSSRLRVRLRRRARCDWPTRRSAGPGNRRYLVVMTRSFARSRGVTQTLAAAARECPADTEIAFDELYRRSRDDVYAYVAGLLRDRSAAEDVTALAFERAYRRRRSFNPKRGSDAPGCSGSPATRRSTSCGAGGVRRPWSREPVDVAPVARRRPARRRFAGLRFAALASLTPRERELVALKFFAGLTNSEIAARDRDLGDQCRHPPAQSDREAEEGLR